MKYVGYILKIRLFHRTYCEMLTIEYAETFFRRTITPDFKLWRIYAPDHRF